MIPLRDQEMIRGKLGVEMLNQVKIDFFTERDVGLSVPGKEPCVTCKPAGELLGELSGLSDLISLRTHYVEDNPPEEAQFGIERVPAMVLRGRVLRDEEADWEDARVTFYGIPAGTEFPAFLECLVDFSRGEALLSPESVQELRSIERDISVKVFVTPTCPYCPGMMRLAYQAALVSGRVRAEAIEISEFPELGQQYGVRAVPLTVIDETESVPGMIPEQQLVENIVKAASRPAAAQAPVERGKERASGLYIP
jgi:glutaredoxin-like protein